jgi:signal peptidase I
MREFIRDFFIAVLLAVCVFFSIQAMLLQCVVRQTSMTPTIVEGQRIFINKTAYLFNTPGRGDIIVFNPVQRNSEIPLIKRVIGLPNETITVKNGTVYIDNVPLDEPYLKEVPEYRISEIIVPEDHYFVLGDNRNSSYDSHCGWTVDNESIIGKAWISIWPLDTLGPAPNYAFADN